LSKDTGRADTSPIVDNRVSPFLRAYVRGKVFLRVSEFVDVGIHRDILTFQHLPYIFVYVMLV
jgi:hypothetical protein